jgi:hypothetical protein
MIWSLEFGIFLCFGACNLKFFNAFICALVAKLFLWIEYRADTNIERPTLNIE